MALNSAYKYLLMGEQGGSSQNDACYAGVTGLCMYYDLPGADIMSTKNYGGSVEDSYRLTEGRTQAAGDYSKRIWTNMYKIINQANIIIDALPELRVMNRKSRLSKDSVWPCVEFLILTCC